MPHPTPKVVEAVTTALIEALQADELGYVHDDGDGDYRIDVAVNLPQLVAHLVEIGQTPVDRVLAARKRRDAIKLPDREELARELFIADNWRQSRHQSLVDFSDLSHKDGVRHYYTLADAAIEAFKRANP